MPNLLCHQDDIEDTLTVLAADDNLSWSDFQITGNCDTSGLDTYVKTDDMITDCSGTITIVHIPTNRLYYSWDFT